MLTDPSGEIAPLIIGGLVVGVWLGLGSSPNVANAPDGGPTYADTGPLGSEPQNIIIGGVIGAAAGGVAQQGLKVCGTAVCDEAALQSAKSAFARMNAVERGIISRVLSGRLPPSEMSKVSAAARAIAARYYRMVAKCAKNSKDAAAKLNNWRADYLEGLTDRIPGNIHNFK